MSDSFNPDDYLIGAATIGERGQVVIPKEFRDKLGLKPGTKLVVMQHENGPVCLMKADAMQEFIQKMTKRIHSVLKK